MKNNGTKNVQSLHLGAMKAIKVAVAKAIRQHEAEGVPAAIWKNGKVVHLKKNGSRSSK